jgi:undecaprenyl-diphosphatase
MMLLQAAILGIIQGLTEFLPISSSGHLILARHFFGWDQTWPLNNPQIDLSLDLALHLGTALAVLFYFREDLWRIFSSLGSKDTNRRQDRCLAIGIILGSIPAAVIGKLLESQVEVILRSHLVLIGVFLIVFGILLWGFDRFRRKTMGIEDVTIGNAFWIGVAQTLALMPGVSRSGITMTAGMAFGLKREAAARFSFLLMTPIVVGAALAKLLDLRHVPSDTLHQVLPSLALGFITSTIVGVLCIAFLLKYLRSNSLLPFTIYRILLGTAVIAALVTQM